MSQDSKEKTTDLTAKTTPDLNSVVFKTPEKKITDLGATTLYCKSGLWRENHWFKSEKNTLLKLSGSQDSWEKITDLGATTLCCNLLPFQTPKGKTSDLRATTLGCTLYYETRILRENEWFRSNNILLQLTAIEESWEKTTDLGATTFYCKLIIQVKSGELRLKFNITRLSLWKLAQKNLTPQLEIISITNMVINFLRQLRLCACSHKNVSTSFVRN